MEQRRSPSVVDAPESIFIRDTVGSIILGRTPPPVSGILDWDSLVRLVLLTNSGPVCSYIHGRNEAIRREIRAEWQRSLVGTLAAYEATLRAALRLSDVAAREKIPFAVLRGIAVAHTVYPDTCLRPMHDLDVLVRRQDVHRFLSALEREGLKPEKSLQRQYVFRVDGVLVEVHWSFISVTRYEYAADFESWLESAVTIETKAGRLPVLNRENQLLSLVCHAFMHHELDQFLALVDIALASSDSRVDWEIVARWCGENRLQRVVGFTVGFARHMFGLDPEVLPAKLSGALPRGVEAVYRAYAMWVFGEDTLCAYFRRKRNMIFVAEGFGRKYRQCIRLARPRDVAWVWRLARAGRISRGFHSEHDSGTSE